MQKYSRATISALKVMLSLTDTECVALFCMRSIMKAAHNEHLFIDDINKGYFRVDQEGRIWKIAIKHWTNPFIEIPEREMKYKNNSGYINISFNKNGKIYKCFAHRIIWIYFNGEIPDNLEINHINGIKTDNRPENLEVITTSENHKHAYRIGLKNGQKGEKQGNSRLTNDNIREIRIRCEDGEFQTVIAQDFNIDPSNVSHIVNRKRWAHIT